MQNGMRGTRETPSTKTLNSVGNLFARSHASCAGSKPDACTKLSDQSFSHFNDPQQGLQDTSLLYVGPSATQSPGAMQGVSEVLYSATQPHNFFYLKKKVLYSCSDSNRMNGVGKQHDKANIANVK